MRNEAEVETIIHKMGSVPKGGVGRGFSGGRTTGACKRTCSQRGREGVLTGVGRLDQGLEGRMRPLRVEGRKGE